MPNFLSGSPRHATSCKPHTHDDVFPLPPTKSPSLAFNLVGRRLRWAKRAAHTLPPIGRASAYCCLLCQPNCTPGKHTSDFVMKNIKRTIPSAPPPPLHFHHPPSPGAPLNCVQRVRSRSREDIEGGGHAPDHVSLDGRAARRRRRRRRRIAAAVVRREGHYAVSGVITERG